MRIKETLYQGGYLKTTLLDATYVRSNIVNAGYVNTLALDAAVITSGQIAADRINVNDLIVKSLRTAASGQRIEVLATNNNMVFYDAAGNEVFRLDDDIDSSQSGTPLGGIRMLTPGGDASYGSGNGFFANGSGITFLPGSSGINTNGSVVGLLRYRNSDSNGLSAAVVGIDQTTTGNSKSYAGYFSGTVAINGESRLNGAVYNNSITVSGASYTCSANDYLVLNSGTGSITLPSVAANGRTIIVTNITSGSRNVNGGSYNIREGSGGVSQISLPVGTSCMFIFASSLNNWIAIR